MGVLPWLLSVLEGQFGVSTLRSALPVAPHAADPTALPRTPAQRYGPVARTTCVVISLINMAIVCELGCGMGWACAGWASMAGVEFDGACRGLGWRAFSARVRN